QRLDFVVRDSSWTLLLNGSRMIPGYYSSQGIAAQNIINLTTTVKNPVSWHIQVPQELFTTTEVDFKDEVRLICEIAFIKRLNHAFFNSLDPT
ncbi:MAG: hypothetical protein K2Z81_23485, partial [Cyanobacteria bacterium]|nr:hypothetical protein [Cyanobacteriota bacterium]